MPLSIGRIKRDGSDGLIVASRSPLAKALQMKTLL
jgi:hypothetical protein